MLLRPLPDRANALLRIKVKLVICKFVEINNFYKFNDFGLVKKKSKEGIFLLILRGNEEKNFNSKKGSIVGLILF